MKQARQRLLAIPIVIQRVQQTQKRNLSFSGANPIDTKDS
jgi:hypothetical protein